MATASSRTEAIDIRPVLSRIAIAVLLFVVGVEVAGVVLSVRFGAELADLTDFDVVGAGLFVGVLPFALSGGYLARRRPSNAVGWWLLAVAFFWTAPLVATMYGALGVATTHGPLPGDEFALVSAAVMWAPGFLAIGMVVFLFPTGQPVSPRWRWVTPTAIGATLLLSVSTVLTPGIVDDAGIENPIAWVEGESITSLIFAVANFVFFVLGGTAGASLILRYKRSGSTERQQIKWLLFPLAVALIATALGLLRDLVGWRSISPAIDAFEPFALLAVAFIPVAITIAVMRYGLYDLGRIVNRTVVYGIVALLLGGVYSTGVLLLSAVLPDSGNPLAVAMSTLAAAALFNPLRRRIQGLVNRRLYRFSYDPEQVQQQLRDEIRGNVHPEQIADELVKAANNALAPEASAVWIRRTSWPRSDRAVH